MFIAETVENSKVLSERRFDTFDKLLQGLKLLKHDYPSAVINVGQMYKLHLEGDGLEEEQRKQIEDVLNVGSVEVEIPQ